VRGHTFKRCTCPLRRDEAGNRVTCPRQHGSWVYVADVSPQEPGQKRRQQTKGGFATRREAEAGLQEYLRRAQLGQVVAPSRLTVEDYLAQWLERVTLSLAVTAASNYRTLVRCYVLPHLAQQRLTNLRADHLVAAYRTLLARGGRGGGPLSATTVRTVHRVLSKALADAARDGKLARNWVPLRVRGRAGARRGGRAGAWTGSSPQPRTRRGGQSAASTVARCRRARIATVTAREALVRTPVWRAVRSCLPRSWANLGRGDPGTL